MVVRPPNPLVVLALSVLLGACADDPEPAGEPAVLRGAALSRLDVGAADAATPAAITAHAGEAAVEDADASIGLRWGFEPEQLRVYRDTEVRFRLDQAPADHGMASCHWNFGDGTPTVDGCQVSHVFRGGLADQVVTLTLRDGPWEWQSTHTVPLERLTVVPDMVDGSGVLGELPPAPDEGPTSFRFALVADSATTGGVATSVRDAVKALSENVEPELVIHVGGVVPRGGGDPAWDAAREAIAAPIGRAGAKVAWATSSIDRAEGARVKRPELQMIDGAHYPEQYSFTYKGAYFAVFSADETSGVSEETIRWLRAELGKARVYEARYVITYLPLHKFGDEHLGSLDKKFRLYELFLRGRVTTLFSAGYRVYFKGRYGALPVVSVGALAGDGGSLSGSDFEQPASFVVVDVDKGVPERVFAVEGPEFTRTMDESLLPGTVEVYTQ